MNQKDFVVGKKIRIFNSFKFDGLNVAKDDEGVIRKVPSDGTGWIGIEWKKRKPCMHELSGLCPKRNGYNIDRDVLLANARVINNKVRCFAI
ncbi:hypothetical protein GTO27_03450 [Candidatus Bathyarchaeota archaeon]|nr:hypothetical protein [Candidatus Bathyarchaeota archaeon]